jgi:hypothetical protein
MKYVPLLLFLAALVITALLPPSPARGITRIVILGLIVIFIVTTRKKRIEESSPRKTQGEGHPAPDTRLPLSEADLSLPQQFWGDENNYNGKQRFFRFGAVGSPDIIAVVRGQYIGIEVKSSDGSQSESQQKVEAELTKAGGQ